MLRLGAAVLVVTAALAVMGIWSLANGALVVGAVVVVGVALCVSTSGLLLTRARKSRRMPEHLVRSSRNG
jgi:hypothetical protein